MAMGADMRGKKFWNENPAQPDPGLAQHIADCAGALYQVVDMCMGVGRNFSRGSQRRFFPGLQQL